VTSAEAQSELSKT